jgi:hypothetical protein
MKIIIKTALTSLLSLSLMSSATVASAIELADLKKAEKISVTLTGLPLTPEQRAAFMAGTLTLESLAETLTKSPDFIEKYAEFWTKTIGLVQPIDIYSLRTFNGQVNPGTNGQGRYVFGTAGTVAATLDVAKLQANLKSFKDRTGGQALNVIQCADAPMIIAAQQGDIQGNVRKIADTGIGGDGNPVLPNTLPEWKKLADFFDSVRPTCEAATSRVKPWWDPITVTAFARYKGVESYKISAELLADCGATMEKCNASDAKNADRVSNMVARDITLEAGYIIAHTVAEDRPFAEILTTPSTIMTGTYAEWMSHAGSGMWKSFPGQSFEGATADIFTKPNILDRKHYRVQRNNLHAGVLTTMSFQLVTNGRRAKANRAYESFLCRKFTVPAGANPDPNDANPDLTKRSYCAFCHKALEPMAAFWNRWPDTGALDYRYDPSDKINDTGAFNGSSGLGAAAYGKVLSENSAFNECSVARAFEFVNGRKMTATESDNNLTAWLGDFTSSQQNLRRIIKAMVLAPEFLSNGGQ